MVRICVSVLLCIVIAERVPRCVVAQYSDKQLWKPMVSEMFASIGRFVFIPLRGQCALHLLFVCTTTKTMV
jgi:hypothetical protein